MSDLETGLAAEREDVSQLLSLVNSAMVSDRHRLRRMLGVFAKGKAPSAKVVADARKLLKESLQRAESRRKLHPAVGDVPRLRFDDPLPICERIDEIAEAIDRHRVVVIAGETGSGKSTQIPKICLKLGRGVHGMIGHTQPRRIAARSIATRLAEDLQTPVGEGVGFKVRFADAVSPRTHIKVMTDGILLAEIQSDRFLDAYDTLIIDEAHERSLNIDLLMGYLHRLIVKRADLRVIITSATIDAARFATFFDSPDGVIPEEDSGGSTSLINGGRTPVIEVSGRTYPVETRYRPVEADDNGEIDPGAAIANAATELLTEAPGDILVFLPTEREIRDTAEILRGRFRGGSPASGRDVEILPLYGRLSEKDQHRIFEQHQGLRIVLATNVAESSLTVPGIRSVIDTGTARISRFTPQSKVQRLPIEEISRASADQRKGRCGRTAPGICVRLYSEQDYLDREAYTPPEILRTNLAAAVLQTLSSSLGDISALPLLDRPQPGAIRAGYGTLSEIGAIEETPNGYRLTDRGRILARLPVDPRIGRMIVAGHEQHCLNEVLIIAAALEVRDPRDRPVEKQQAADEAHRQFLVEGSDFLTLLKIWDTYQDWSDRLSNSQVRRTCQKSFLSHSRMREWRDLQRQLSRLVMAAGMKPGPRHDDSDAVHRALLAGLLSNIAVRGETTEYTGAGDQTLVLWPGSSAFSKKPKWIVAAELVETTRRYARTVGTINPDWIEKLAEALVKRSHSDPQWDRSAGSAMAYERVTLYGLPIVPRRRCRLGPFDPAKARELFIQHALVEGDYETKAAFHRENAKLKEELKDWQAKLRKTQIFASEEQQFQFFDERLPQDVVDSRSFERWRKTAEAENPTILHLTRDALLVDPAVSAPVQAFPDEMPLGGTTARIEYRLEPGAENDGLTLVVPAQVVGRLNASRLGWLVPGMIEEKVESLIKTLPKELRRLFVPINDTARDVVSRLTFGEGDLVEQMASILRQLSGEHVPVEAFDRSRLGSHLNFRIQAVDDSGRLLAQGDNVSLLQQQMRGESAAAFSTRAKNEKQWHVDGLRSWTFGELPEMVQLAGQDGLIAHPMLVDQKDAVGLRLTDDPTAAERSTRRGLVRLLLMAASSRIDQQVTWLPQLDTALAQAAGIMQAVDTTRSAGAEPAKQTPRGYAAEFRRQLAYRIAERAADVALPVPRTNAGFARWLKIAEGRVSVAAQEVAELLAPLLSKGRDVQKLVVSNSQPALAHAVSDITSQWVELFRPGFFAETSWSSLTQFPRYLDAIQARWKKLLAGGLAKDRDMTSHIGAFWSRYLQIVRGRPEVAEAFEPVRWLLEEYRVSQFAQQLKTNVSVSEKRIREVWTQAAGSVGK